MMISEITIIHNLSEFMVIVQEASAFKETPRWYRGCGKISYELVPSLYRHPVAKSSEDFKQLESEIMARFKERSLPHLTRNLDHDSHGWENLFLMQHHGVPTRLLDWTENPFFALLFALIYADHEWVDGEAIYPEDASVWILDPVAWNRSALRHTRFQEGIVYSAHPNAQPYAPDSGLNVMPTEPIAIYGTYNSARIVAQRGVFTIFGQSTDPMEAKPYAKETLIKLVIPRSHIRPTIAELTSIGITDSSIFPDLDGLARDLKRKFGYRVRV